MGEEEGMLNEKSCCGFGRGSKKYQNILPFYSNKIIKD
jgi:hypothetical protein